MSATEEDIADIIRRDFPGVGSAPGQEPRGVGWWGPSNAFARFAGGARDPLLQMMNVRIKPLTSAWATSTRMAAQRFLRSLNTPKVSDVYSSTGFTAQSPWAIRKELGKSGKLYKLGDIIANVVRNNKAVNRAKEEAAKREIARESATKKAQALVREDIGRRPPVRGFTPGVRPAGSYAAPAIAGAGNALITTYTNLWYEQQRLRERRANILAVGRRGAGAVRALARSAIPGRTGAKSTRALDTRIAGTKSGVSKPTAAAAKLPTDQSTVAGESAASKAARRAMESNKSLPGIVTKTTEFFKIPSKFSVTLRTPTFTDLLQQSLTAPRARARLSTPVQTRARAPLAPLAMASAIPTLTNTLVGSQVLQAKCDCPKPKKKSPSEQRCSNPVVSRTIKDGFITTKRKLQCQPSKQK